MKSILILALFFLSIGLSYGQTIQDSTAFETNGVEWKDGQMWPGIYYVSIIELISNPEKYDNQKVVVSGFLHLGFEHNAIYLHESDYTYLLTKNGLWIELGEYVKSNISQDQFSNNYVKIMGVFDMNNNGHMDVFNGAIKNIQLITIKK